MRICGDSIICDLVVEPVLLERVRQSHAIKALISNGLAHYVHIHFIQPIDHVSFHVGAVPIRASKLNHVALTVNNLGTTCRERQIIYFCGSSHCRHQSYYLYDKI